MESVAIVCAVICIVSIFALFVFCAVKPHLGLAGIFYFLMGGSIIPVLIYMYIDGQVGPEALWGLVMSLACFFGGFVSVKKYFAVKGTSEEKKANEEWGKISRRQGVRRMWRFFRK